MFALVDCNNFYASCERVFNPSLIGRPVIVLSNNDGCVIARSNEAKHLGVKMGSPAFKLKSLIDRENIAVFSSNYTLYGDMSQRVMNTLAQFTPDIEIYSIDEAFLGLHGFNHIDLHDYARTIRRITTRNTGIPVSIGIAQTKTLAKVANHLAKKMKETDGVVMVSDDTERIAALKQTPVAEVWGIGRRYGRLLARNGVETALDFSRLPAGWVRKNMSVVGERIQKELLGISCIELQHSAPPKKAICTSRSFGTMQTRQSYVAEAVASFASSCAYKLRKQGSVAQLITVFIHTNYFRDDLPQYAAAKTLTLPEPTNSSIELAHFARLALGTVFRPGFRYKKAGVVVGGISDSRFRQAALFSSSNWEKHDKLMRVMDRVNSKYGRNTVRLAAQGSGREWKLRQERLSPCYTTCWDDIIRVNV